MTIFILFPFVIVVIWGLFKVLPPSSSGGILMLGGPVSAGADSTAERDRLDQLGSGVFLEDDGSTFSWRHRPSS